MSIDVIKQDCQDCSHSLKDCLLAHRFHLFLRLSPIKSYLSMLESQVQVHTPAILGSNFDFQAKQASHRLAYGWK